MQVLDVLAPRRITLSAFVRDAGGERPVASVSWQGWDEFDASWAQTIRGLRGLFGEGVLSWRVSVSARRIGVG